MKLYYFSKRRDYDYGVGRGTVAGLWWSDGFVIKGVG